MQIGIALSGGGVRATVFHFGVLARLAAGGLHERIAFLSTVSGGSLAAGLCFAWSGGAWPSSEVYLHQTLPKLRWLLTATSLQWAYGWRSLILPWRLLRGRAGLLARMMRTKWSIEGSLGNLPETPRWIINATCYETGKNWRFMRRRMGDWQANYVLEPAFPLAEAMAASAAVPGLIGPLKLKTARYVWHRLDDDRRTTTKVAPLCPLLRLWDGGVYDNLGVEALFKPAGGYRDGVDFLLVSDAAQQVGCATGRFRGRAALRLIDIATDQVRALRERMIVAYLHAHPGTGALLRIGNTLAAIFDEAKTPLPPALDLTKTLSPEDVGTAVGFETTLRKLAPHEFSLLLQHGYEVADATLAAYCPHAFDHVPFPESLLGRPVAGGTAASAAPR